MNDHQSKDLSIETNSFNHNKGTETEISANDNHGSLKCATDNGNEIKHCKFTCTGETTNWWFA